MKSRAGSSARPVVLRRDEDEAVGLGDLPAPGPGALAGIDAERRDAGFVVHWQRPVGQLDGLERKRHPRGADPGDPLRDARAQPLGADAGRDDDVLLAEAGVSLDRALFPLVARLGALGPMGVVELGEQAGRDHTTISRQLTALEAQREEAGGG